MIGETCSTRAFYYRNMDVCVGKGRAQGAGVWCGWFVKLMPCNGQPGHETSLDVFMAAH